MTIELLTFTGVDSQTDFAELARLYGRYPRVEFGILIGSQTSKVDNGIFPSYDTINKFREWAHGTGCSTAVHLCGTYSREIMEPTPVSEYMIQFCNWFDRVQVNLHGDYFNPNDIEVQTDRITEFVEGLECKSVILQHRDVWEKVPVQHDSIEYLFDKSGGRGQLSIGEWPAPIEELDRVGYAGGLGPKTMLGALNFADMYTKSRLWFDMEGRIRKDGWLDLEAVASVCKQTFRY